ncbi:MAG TPA: NlpC/P60 family protein [Chthoniobacterales bacterium]|nr:NlpC/P60 family protein [Chthoniobacterales bacterium]
MLSRAIIIVLCLFLAVPAGYAAQDKLGQTLKKIFSTPTPTPHRKKKSSSSTKKKTPTPTATPSPKKKPSPPAEETPTPTVAGKKKRTPQAESPSPTASSRRKKKGSPTASPTETPEPSTSPTPTPLESATPSASPSLRHGAPNASLSPEQIKGFENYPENVKKVLATALELTTRNLTYKYGSDDPSSGGMDCSGFVFYVLKQNGITDVPRDSSGQYVWLRRAGKFEPVISRKDNSFELENLRPGDLLFWTGTYAIDRDPPITHAMIYLGREKKSGERVMVGSSDGRVYQGESRNGVSVFDFKIPRPEKNGNGKLQPSFVGYGHIPGLEH